MFFKFYISKLFYLFLIIFLLSGCDLKFNEKPPKSSDIVFSAGQKVLCLSKTIPYFKSFLKAEPKGESVKEFWDCAEVAVRTFKQKSIGNDKNQYSAKAMALFFEKYFLDSVQISDTLIDESMRIKQLLLGGDRTYLTPNELEEVLEIIHGLGYHSEKMFPFMKVFLKKWKPQVVGWEEQEITYFDSANLALQNFTHDFAKWIHADGPDYPIEHFLILVREFEKLSDTNTDLSKPLTDVIPVLQKIKKVFCGGNENTINSNEWRNFLLLGSRSYFLYLRFDLFVDLRKTNLPEQVWFVSKAIEDGLELMSELLQNKKISQVTNDELIEVFEKFQTLYPDFKYSKDWLAQIMNIKKSLLGGSSEFLSVSDFENAKSKIDILRKITIDIIPYSQVFLNKWNYDKTDTEEAKKYFEDAYLSVEKGTYRYILLWDNSIDLSQITNLLDESQKLYPAKEIIYELKNKWTQYYPVILSLNNLFSGKQNKNWSPEQSQLFFKNIISIYHQYQYYTYFLKDASVSTLEGLNNWNNWVLSSASRLSQLINMRKPSIWQSSDMFELVDSLDNAKLLPANFKPQFVKKLVKLTFETYLKNKNTLSFLDSIYDSTTSKGLTTYQIDKILGMWIDWFEIQKFNINFYNSLSKNEMSFVDFKNQFLAYLNNMKKTNLYSAKIDEFSQIILVNQNLMLNKNFLIEQTSPEDNTWSPQLESLTYLNTSRVLIDLIVNTYQAKPGQLISEKKLSLPEFKNFLDDISPLLTDLGWITQYKNNYVESRFQEANLFTPSSDGDSNISFSEGIQYLNLIISAYTRLNIFKVPIVKNCSSDIINSKIFYNKKCVENILIQNNKKIFSNMNQFLPYFDSLNINQKTGLINNLEFASDSEITNDSIKESDLLFIISLTQYIETVIIRFDNKNDGVLNTKESLKAFPVFRNLLAKMSKIEDNDNRLRAIFTYLLKFAKTPEKSISGYYDFWQWEQNPDEWDLSVSRYQFTLILSALQKEKNSKLIENVEE